jgi:hypothetical protein
MHYCPLCLKALKGRFAEISHFNTHASRGELIREPWDPDGYSWRFIQGGEPFTQGIDVTGHEAPDHTTLFYARLHFLNDRLQTIHDEQQRMNALSVLLEFPHA